MRSRNPPRSRGGVPLLLRVPADVERCSASSTGDAARVEEREAQSALDGGGRSLSTWTRRPASPSSVISTATGARTRRSAYHGAFGMANESSRPHPAPGADVLPAEDQRAGAGGLGAAPIRHDGGHEVGHRGPAVVEVVLRVRVADAERVDAEDPADVVVADVFEIPGRTAVAGDARPSRADGDRRRSRPPKQRSTVACSGGLLNARHSAAKRTPASAGIGERPQVGADTEVVGDPLPGSKGRSPPVGDETRKGTPGTTVDQGRDGLFEQRTVPALAAAARTWPPADGSRCCYRPRSREGRALKQAELLAHLDTDALDELGLFGRIEAGQHAVLPDQDPQFVAEIPEHRILVRHVTADPHHVHAGVDEQLQRPAELLPRSAGA